MDTSTSFCLNNGSHVSDIEHRNGFEPHKCIADRIGKGDFSDIYSIDTKTSGRSLKKVLQNGLPNLPENARQLYIAEQNERLAYIRTMSHFFSSIGENLLSSTTSKKMNEEIDAVMFSFSKKEEIKLDDEDILLDRFSEILGKYVPESDMNDSNPAMQRLFNFANEPHVELADARKNHKDAKDKVEDVVYAFKRNMQGLLHSLDDINLDDRDSSNELKCVKSLFQKSISRVAEQLGEIPSKVRAPTSKIFDNIKSSIDFAVSLRILENKEKKRMERLVLGQTT